MKAKARLSPGIIEPDVLRETERLGATFKRLSWRRMALLGSIMIVACVALSGLAIAILSRGDVPATPSLEEHVRRFETGKSSELHLSQFSGFNWNQLTIITPYQDGAKVAAQCKVSGVKSGGTYGMLERDDTHGIRERDDIVVLALSNSGEFVKSVPFSRKHADFCSLGVTCVPREKANFRRSDGGTVEFLSE